MPSATRDFPAPESAAAQGRGRFATTHWSVVLRAARPGGSRAADAAAALARLCQTYWFPLYAHARRRGLRPHDAQDLTQDFFARLLERDLLARADQRRGRFRSFVLTALDHFLADEWTKARAQKRGGATQVVSYDAARAEERFTAEPVDAAAPDKAFDRRWALVLLDRVLTRLESDYAAAGKAAVFAVLKQALIGSSATRPYADLAAELGLAEGAVKVAVHRLRRRYRDLLEDEIAQTVATPDEAAAELRYLFQALSEG